MMRASRPLSAILGFTILVQLTFEVSAADTISYIGAVVEYYPVKNGADGNTLATANAENYVTIIKTAWNYNADIIVFPESSLTTGLQFSSTNRSLYPSFSSIVPDPGTDTPCDNSSTVVIEALQLISCAAKRYSIYVLVNLHEMENCTTTGTTTRPCPSDGYFFYNTNVVFNRAGSIVSRYRKFNLFGEPGFNVTSTPDMPTFTTDFNVTFGHVICFDILFNTPTLTLINEYNVTDILFPTHWFSELPYLTAVQAQSGWSYANDVNLLAAGYNTPASGSTGSGIYIGKGGNLVTFVSETEKNAILVARVPKVIDGVRSYIAPGSLPLTYEFSDTEIPTLVNVTKVAQQALIQDTLTHFTTSVLKLTNGTATTSQELCDREFCCTFDVTRTFSEESVNSSVNHYKYRIAVFNGVRDHSGVATTGVQVCSIISCTNDTLPSCGLRFAATDTVVNPTVFNNIVISGNFSTKSDTMQMPNSLTTDMLPLNVSEFTYTVTDLDNTSLADVTYNSTIEITNLLTFAIYGRNFSADFLEATGPLAGSSAIPLSRLPAVVTTVLAATVTLLFLVRH